MADIIRLVSRATNTFLDINSVTVDNWTFKLFYKFSVILLISSSVLVASKQFFGGPISCDAGQAKITFNDEVLKSYCWMYANFKIPSSYQGPCSSAGMDTQDMESPIYNSYYQWVSIYLFGIAFLFYTPRGLWITMEGGLMKLFCKGTATKHVEEPEDKIKKLLKYFAKNIHRKFRVYFLGFIFCQFFNLCIVIATFGLTHIFLHRRFLLYGFQVWRYYQLPYEEQTKSNPMCYAFPRITSCDYYRYGSGGTQERISALCILSLNIVNDKVFLILWWWFVFLILCSIIEISFCFIQILSPKCRFQLIRFRMHRYFRRNSNIIDVEKYILECGSGDWFVLYQMSKNLNRVFFMEFLVRLCQEQYNTGRSLGCGLDDPDFGGGSIVDLMLQPTLHDEDQDRREDREEDEEDTRNL